MAAKLKKLNLGCGSNKLPGYINIDVEPSCNPDIVFDFVNKKLPYGDDSIDEIVFFHCIEHINKNLHQRLLTDLWRVLKFGGELYISYPEFTKCYENWKSNHRGQKKFWEATIFGRQAYPSDFHVCIMHTPDFEKLLTNVGFKNILSTPEAAELHNTVINCQKKSKPTGYEDVLRTDMEKTRFKRVRL
jgi:predicted SAM-dependent methyltransferase